MLGQPIKLGDKAYTSQEFVTPPKKNTKRPSRWKPYYSRMPQRVETVFSQLVNAHIRLGQFHTLKALKLRVALSLLAHNRNLWGVTHYPLNGVKTSCYKLV